MEPQQTLIKVIICHTPDIIHWLVTDTTDASNKVAATSCFDCLRYLTLCYGKISTNRYEPNVA